MQTPSHERKLTTILSADVVGFSTLMNHDENATLSALQLLRRSLINPKIEEHRGRTIKLMGDGALVEFGSVVDAVHFAIDIQHEMKARLSDTSKNEDIQFRIGINVGDIIVDGGDIYGDGVNIASRIEALAEPGGICVSKTVFDHVEGKLDVDMTSLGEQQVKNIPSPVYIYKIELNNKSKLLSSPVDATKSAHLVYPQRIAIAASILAAVIIAGLFVWQPWTQSFAKASVERMDLPLPEKPSLVVLPFNDFSDDLEHAYFADGMTEDLITDLSKISGIFVISRNSSWIYKDRPTLPREVAEELGVQYILEGSVRRSGDQFRVNAQLIDALGGHHIWADRYDSDLDEVFALQDEVISEITSALAVQLSATEAAEIGEGQTQSTLAYDAVLSGLELLRRGSEEDVHNAIATFEKAIEIDPNYNRAYAGLAAAHWRVAQSLWSSTTGGGFEKAWQGVLANIDRAMEQPSALAYSILSEMLVAQGQHDEAFDELDKALALAPNDPDIHVAKAKVLNAIGRAAEAEAALRYAVRFDPLQTTRYLRELGVSQLHQKKYSDAVATMRRVLERETDIVADIVTLASALGHLDLTEEIPELARKYDEIAVPSNFDPFTAEEPQLWWYGDMFGYDREYREHLFDGLIKAGAKRGAGIDLHYDVVRDLITQEEGQFYVRDVPRITTDEAKILWENDNAKFVDVRAILDFNAGHIPGSHNLSLITALSRERLLEIASLDETVVFNCHGYHCPYSAYASAKAKLWGFNDPRYYAGGFPDWNEVGLPITTGDSQ